MRNTKPMLKRVIFLAVMFLAITFFPAQASEYPLNRETHNHYLNGKSDTIFAPNQFLTRAETAQIIYSLLTEKPDITKEFSDVKEQWYAEAVNALYSAGIVRSRSNSSQFDPDKPISRAELAEILYQFCEESEKKDVCTFSDVPETYWAYRFIATMSGNEWMTGYPDQTFKPGNPLTRAEMAVTCNRFLNRHPDKATIDNAEEMRIFTDVESSLWAYNDIMEAAVSHEYTRELKTNGETLEHWTTLSVPRLHLAEGVHLFDHHLYYVDGTESCFVRNKTIKGYTFGKDGRYTTGSEELDKAIYEIISETCSNQAASEDNLRAVYNYVRDNFIYQVRAHVERGATGWDLEYAVPMMKTHYGNCYSWAAVFTYLARSIGFEAYSLSGAVGVRQEDHGWTEIMFDDTWYIFDPELEHSNHGKLLFYKIPYDNGFKTYVKYHRP